jgi:hypothetical protein
MLELNDELFPLSKARNHYPTPNPPHPATLMRWALKGVGKAKIKLETVKIGGRRYTSRAALEAFVARLSGATSTAAATQRRRESYRRAERDCEREGL